VLTRPRSEEAARLLDIPNVFEAQARPGKTGRTMLLQWGPHALRVGDSLPGGAGDTVRWAVLPANVLLQRPDKPWGSHLENPIPVEVEELIELGSEVLAWLRPKGIPQSRLQMRLPVRAVRRYAVSTGKPAMVCVRAADIILFDADNTSRP
jgi:molybdate transport system ATP-binding protein